MSVQAAVAYTLQRDDVTERIEVTVLCDAGYSPDVASDLAARARAALAEAVAENWPPVDAP